MLPFDTLWDYQDPKATEQRLRALLPEARASGDRSYCVQLLTQIGRTLSLQGRFDEAHAVLDEAESRLTPELRTARIRCLLERGRSYNSAQRQALAIPLFEQAWALGLAAGEDFHAVDAAHMLGIAEATPERQMAWNRQALDLAERSETARRWLGSLYNNIGWTLAGQGQYPAALPLFERAVNLRAEQGTPAQLRSARWCVAKMKRLLGSTVEALAMQEDLLADARAHGDPYGFIAEELGECLLALGRAAEARPHFAAAYRLLSQDAWLVRDEPARLERLRALGDPIHRGSAQQPDL